jgi:hypothetical protein
VAHGAIDKTRIAEGYFTPIAILFVPRAQQYLTLT